MSAGVSANRQTGDNCRFVALGNVLQDKPPDREELFVAQLALVDECYPEQLAVYSAASALDWSLTTVSSESLMTRVWEARLPHHTAVVMAKDVLARRDARWGVSLVAESTREDDEEARGFAYFNAGHCMSTFRVDGKWYTVTGNTPVMVTAARARDTATAHTGCVLLFSPDACLRVLERARASLRTQLARLVREGEVTEEEAKEEEGGDEGAAGVTVEAVAMALHGLPVLSDLVEDAFLVQRMRRRLNDLNDVELGSYLELLTCFKHLMVRGSTVDAAIPVATMLINASLP